MDVEKIINLLMFSFAQAVIVTFLMYLFCENPKVVAWERRVWAKFKRFIRRQLRKSKTIVAWAETPTKHGSPDMAWIEGQVKVYGDEWR